MCFLKHIVLFPSVAPVTNIFCVALTCSFALRQQIIHERRKLPPNVLILNLFRSFFSIFNFPFVSNQWLCQWIMLQVACFFLGRNCLHTFTVPKKAWVCVVSLHKFNFKCKRWNYRFDSRCEEGKTKFSCEGDANGHELESGTLLVARERAKVY